MGHRTVMLSTFAPLSVNSAKHLEAQRERPFAALRVTRKGHPIQRRTDMLSTFASLSVNSSEASRLPSGQTLR